MDFIILLGLVGAFSVCLPFLNSLLALGGMLLVSALCCTLILGSMLGSWFGFILFLIYITGLLVLFGYMLAMSPNNFYSSSYGVKRGSGALFFILFMSLFFGSYAVLSPMLESVEWQEGVVNIFCNSSLPVYWLIGVVLFVVLVIAVTLCYKCPKPLRSFLK